MSTRQGADKYIVYDKFYFYFPFTRQNNTKPGLAVQFTLDFDENKATNDGDRIRNIILKKSGRYESEDTLYLVIKKFLVYLKSLRVELEVKLKPDDTGYRPRIPWRKFCVMSVNVYKFTSFLSAIFTKAILLL